MQTLVDSKKQHLETRLTVDTWACLILSHLNTGWAQGFFLVMAICALIGRYYWAHQSDKEE